MRGQTVRALVHNRRTGQLGWFGLAVAIAACGQPSNTPQLTERDSAGISIVTDFSPAAVPAATITVDTVPTLEISSEALGYARFIKSALRLPDHSIIVRTEFGPIMWFDTLGTLLRQIARVGEGPGEFPGGGAIVLRGDSVLVGGSFKHALFGPDGALVREYLITRPVEAWWGCGPGASGNVLPDGGWIDCMRVAGSAEPPSPKSGLTASTLRMHLVTARGDSNFPLGNFKGIESYNVRLGDGRLEDVTHPFLGSSYLAVRPDGQRIASVTNPAYEVTIWDTKGQLARIIRRP